MSSSTATAAPTHTVAFSTTTPTLTPTPTPKLPSVVTPPQSTLASSSVAPAPGASLASNPTTSAPAASRPRLLPQNRRLRHVKGLTLLNLLLVRPSTPTVPVRASDDAAIPPLRRSSHSLASAPSRKPTGLHLSASPPTTTLQLVRSSEDLRLEARRWGESGHVQADVGIGSGDAGGKSSGGEGDGSATGYDGSDADAAISMGANDSAKGPAGKARGKGKAVPPKTRRRWSLALAGHGAGPRQRQAALEKAIDSKLADAFFSFHCEGEADPVYISEVVEKSMNFHFSPFDLSQHSPFVSRGSTVVVRFWVRRRSQAPHVPLDDETLQNSLSSRPAVTQPDRFLLLLEDTIFLPAMKFLTSTALPERLPPNTILIHLTDGTYSLDLPTLPRPHSPTRRQLAEPVPTTSYGTLMRLAALEMSIADVVATQANLSYKIDGFLRPPKTTRDLDVLGGAGPDDLANIPDPASSLPHALDRAKRARAFLATQERVLASAKAQREGLIESLRRRREAMRAGREARATAEATMAAAADGLASQRALASHTRDLIRGQRRRICVELADIFPIESDPRPEAPPLSFRICGLPLPNATREGGDGWSDGSGVKVGWGGGAGGGENGEGGTGSGSGDGGSSDVFSAAMLKELGGAVAEDVLSAALGAVALLVDELQYYLCVPLPYPVTAVGSRSTVRDDISLFGDSAPGASSSNTSAAAAAASRKSGSAPGRRQREFPLHLPRGGSTAAHFRFDYGWFLLNKDVEALCASQGLRVVDMGHTLPNLKYLLYVGGAGTDEVPQRKRGGVKGLWAATVKARAGGGAQADGDGGSVTGSAGEASRRDSTDSEVVGRHAETLRSLARGGDANQGEGWRDAKSNDDGSGHVNGNGDGHVGSVRNGNGNRNGNRNANRNQNRNRNGDRGVDGGPYANGLTTSKLRFDESTT